ncbi:MAG: hypothetical protein M1508_11805 [Nitrospirae bacterium]|nr:hypothetical protein [Nitrospirota bacterium]MCL5423306.1 hypothetical protein [Nitrospirota bacterium]
MKAEGREYLFYAEGEGIDKSLEIIERLLPLCLEGKIGLIGKGGHRIAAIGTHLSDPDRYKGKTVGSGPYSQGTPL